MIQFKNIVYKFKIKCHMHTSKANNKMIKKMLKIKTLKYNNSIILKSNKLIILKMQ